ncbi:MAG: serine/threonine-protein kinase [Anaeromyxobacter sp.]
MVDDQTLPLETSPGGPPHAPLPAGARVGDYAVLGVLGNGTHGAVYLAEHVRLGRRVALKVLHREAAASPELTARFVREARAVNQIRHPGIVDVYDLGELPGGQPYCVMELLRGRTLLAVIAERAPLSTAEAVGYLEPLCEALQAAHAAGVVHRDVKGSNVMVLDEGHPPKVKLLDFGVAKVRDPGGQGLTAVGERLGTPATMSPEQILGQPVDARADVYALGVLFFQLLTGRRPFEAETPEELERQHLEVAPPRPSDLAPVPRAFDAVVARALEKTAARRFPSALALLEAARAALEPSQASGTRRTAALAVHVVTRVTAGGEAVLLAQADAVESAEAALRRAGFELLHATGSSLLAVKVQPPAALDARAAAVEALALGRWLAAAPLDADVQLGVAVHAAEAEVRDTAGGPEVAGGPICRTEAWIPSQPMGFMATPAALAAAGE